MANPQVSNPNDHKVVTFKNSTDLVFTPALGAMYDGRPIFGTTGTSIKPGESLVLPFHVGNLLAKNLAKAVINGQAAETDKAGVPTGVPLWSEESLIERQQSFLIEMYSEEKAAPMSETDILMAKVEEYKKLVEKVLPESEKESLVEDTSPKENDSKDEAPKEEKVYSDKAEVIAELNKRDIQFNARLSKANLEKLLA